MGFLSYYKKFCILIDNYTNNESEYSFMHDYISLQF